jgi:hypothetical protein
MQYVSQVVSQWTTKLLLSSCTVLLEKLIATQMVKKFPLLCYPKVNYHVQSKILTLDSQMHSMVIELLHLTNSHVHHFGTVDDRTCKSEISPVIEIGDKQSRTPHLLCFCTLRALNNTNSYMFLLCECRY